MRFRLGHVLFPDLAHWGGGVSGETGARDSRLKLPLLSLRTLSRRAWLRRRFSGEATARSDLSSFLSPPFAAAASPRREMQKRIANPPRSHPPPNHPRHQSVDDSDLTGHTSSALLPRRRASFPPTSAASIAEMISVPWPPEDCYAPYRDGEIRGRYKTAEFGPPAEN